MAQMTPTHHKQMSKPRALDLFCKAGGSGMGLHRAGFHVTGVDIEPQPRYCGDEFIQADALTFDLSGFDFIWASPPCQAYCALNTMKNARKHPDLVNATRERLIRSGAAYIIENVFGAPLLSPVMLCGSLFNLESHSYQLRRHRYFESNIHIGLTPPCCHKRKTLGIYGSKVRDIALEKRHYAKDKATRGKPEGVVLPQTYGFEAMDISWMSIDELSQAIPPAYSEYLGKQIINYLERVKLAA